MKKEFFETGLELRSESTDRAYRSLFLATFVALFGILYALNSLKTEVVLRDHNKRIDDEIAALNAKIDSLYKMAPADRKQMDTLRDTAESREREYTAFIGNSVNTGVIGEYERLSKSLGSSERAREMLSQDYQKRNRQAHAILTKYVDLLRKSQSARTAYEKRRKALEGAAATTKEDRETLQRQIVTRQSEKRSPEIKSISLPWLGMDFPAKFMLGYLPGVLAVFGLGYLYACARHLHFAKLYASPETADLLDVFENDFSTKTGLTLANLRPLLVIAGAVLDLICNVYFFSYLGELDAGKLEFVIQLASGPVLLVGTAYLAIYGRK
jgi:hypothetical protein